MFTVFTKKTCVLFSHGYLRLLGRVDCIDGIMASFNSLGIFVCWKDGVPHLKWNNDIGSINGVQPKKNPRFNDLTTLKWWRCRAFCEGTFPTWSVGSDDLIQALTKKQHAKFNNFIPPHPTTQSFFPGDETFSAISTHQSLAKDQYSEQLVLCNTQPGHPEEVKILVSYTPLVWYTPPKINMEPKKLLVCRCVSFSKGHFQVPCYFFGRNQIYEATNRTIVKHQQ